MNYIDSIQLAIHNLKNLNESHIEGMMRGLRFDLFSGLIYLTLREETHPQFPRWTLYVSTDEEYTRTMFKEYIYYGNPLNHIGTYRQYVLEKLILLKKFHRWMTRLGYEPKRIQCFHRMMETGFMKAEIADDSLYLNQHPARVGPYTVKRPFDHFKTIQYDVIRFEKDLMSLDTLSSMNPHLRSLCIKRES